MFIIERMDSLGSWRRYSSSSSIDAANTSARNLKSVYPDWSIRVVDGKGNTQTIVQGILLGWGGSK